MKKLLVLVAVGVAVKLFLDSEKGEEVKSYVRDLLGDVQDTFNDYLEKGSQKVERTARQVNDKLAGAME
ncbi:MAG TPA: hypothetical protein VM101_01285 [Flavitalea sp.]|nr:hypothetical protein [Flavitalea sp.]